MMDRLTKIIRPRWMFEAPPETRREFSLDDPWLVETLWETARLGLVPDGGLRDIRAEPVGPAEWNSLVAHLRQSGRSLAYRVGDIEQSLGGFDFNFLGPRLQEETALLTVEFDGHYANTHFYEKAIEFDIDPRDVTTSNFVSLFEFMLEISTVVGRPVTLSDEGYAVLFTIDANRRVAIMPVPAFVSDVRA